MYNELAYVPTHSASAPEPLLCYARFTILATSKEMKVGMKRYRQLV